MCKVILGCLLIFAVAYCNGARILAIVPTPSYSHQVAFHEIWRELSLRGHQVTLLTTDPINDPALTNLTEIDLHFTYELLRVKYNISQAIDIVQEDSMEFVRQFISIFKNIAKDELEYPEVQKLIKKETGQHFDLVMAEIFHRSMYAFSELYQCPLIQIVSLEGPALTYHYMGNPAHPVLQPDVVLPFVTPLNFMERVLSTLYITYMKYYFEYVVLPQETLMIRKYFGEHFPTMQEIGKRVSLLFVNEDPIFNVIRPLVPAVIPIGGGSHIKKSKPLPKNLKKFLDDGDEGVVYFSLGTNVKRANIKNDTIKVILETFSELPYKVLWKIDAEGFANKSDNVLISRWVPQQDVLRHPNVKVFITQGGWQSIGEAIYSHTPMVGLPIFGDQPTNIKKMVARDIALSLKHKTMTKEEFKSTILEVMLNPKYRNQIKKLAQLAQDQPMTGVERAVWWTEYVLRHNGAEHLRSPAIDLPFYQYYLLDVIAFCVTVLAVLAFLLISTIKLVYRVSNRILKYVGLQQKLKTL